MPQVIQALACAKSQGCGFRSFTTAVDMRKAETLRQLEGLIDIYLPDLKYLTPELAAAYSHALIIHGIRWRRSLRWYIRQPQAEFMPEDRTGSESDHAARRDCAPPFTSGHVREAKKVVGYLHETYGDQIYQYDESVHTDVGEICRPQSEPACDKAGIRTAARLCCRDRRRENGFYQEGATADEGFIPEFDYEGVRKK